VPSFGKKCTGKKTQQKLRYPLQHNSICSRWGGVKNHSGRGARVPRFEKENGVEEDRHFQVNFTAASATASGEIKGKNSRGGVKGYASLGFPWVSLLTEGKPLTPITQIWRNNSERLAEALEKVIESTYGGTIKGGSKGLGRTVKDDIRF